MNHDLEGWIKNPGDKRRPDGHVQGTLVDVIHRDGGVFHSCAVGFNYAADFKHFSGQNSSDILYYRPASKVGRVKTPGKKLIEALEGYTVEEKESEELKHTELHVDSRTFCGLIEAISRDKPNTWSFNAGGKGYPHRTLTIGTTKFIEQKGE